MFKWEKTPSLFLRKGKHCSGGYIFVNNNVNIALLVIFPKQHFSFTCCDFIKWNGVF